MNKKRILFISIFGIVVLCVGLFYWHIQRQANYAKTRELFAPIYEYSGRLTPEEQKRFSEFTDSIMNVEPSVAKKYVLPKREMLQLEAHSMALHRDNPELLFIGHGPLPSGTDVDPYIRHFSIRALIPKTKLAYLPTDSRKSIISHLETLEKRLTKNSVEVYIQEVRDMPLRPRQKLPPMHFGVASAPQTVGGGWVLEADGLVLPEGAKRGVIQITDHYGNEYAVDLDDPTDAGTTEDTTELYTKIDQIFEQLIDAELQRLATLNKADRSAEIENLFLSE
ncbi:hypothetical protein C6499_14155 [Candidatus Poribacteria bacterium]|nr:MAG: hypothetical protein C6499_14155 [Candidatus Poribacteria bacterium]